MLCLVRWRCVLGYIQQAKSSTVQGGAIWRAIKFSYLCFSLQGRGHAHLENLSYGGFFGENLFFNFRGKPSTKSFLCISLGKASPSPGGGLLLGGYSRQGFNGRYVEECYQIKGHIGHLRHVQIDQGMSFIIHCKIASSIWSHLFYHCGISWCSPYP